MIRRGVYCEYNGYEFRLNHRSDGTHEIVTKDRMKIDASFILL
ncbi:hypothetical protein [Terribacillus saccharophilus]|nr:hypothetical protein [Terribacillus saccharophilus]